MQQKCSEGSCRKRPILAETVRKYVAENRLGEREGLLLRGSAAMRGFAGCLDHSLDWLERFSPGVGARFRGHTLKRWRRNTAAMRAWPLRQNTAQGCRPIDEDGAQCAAPMMSVAGRTRLHLRAPARTVPRPYPARDRPTATAAEPI